MLYRTNQGYERWYEGTLWILRSTDTMALVDGSVCTEWIRFRVHGTTTYEWRKAATVHAPSAFAAKRHAIEHALSGL